MSDVLEVLERDRWDAPFTQDEQGRAAAALEAGRVLFLPHLAFAVGEDEQAFLRTDASDASRKNVSLDPATGQLHGTAAEGRERARLAAMIDRFGRQAEALVRGLVPAYAPHLERARTSFRPNEIEGRAYTPRHDDRLLHVDAFPTRPMRGKRILRLFANIDPAGGARHWRVGESFEAFAPKFTGRVRRMWPGEARVRAMLGLTKGERSRYDHLMLGLHDAGKLDADWQRNTPRADIDFPAGSVWLCFTDAVLHAALGGKMALEQTFHVPAEAMLEPERAPIRVLERIVGRAL